MLTCSKCGHHDQIEPVNTRWGKELHCHYCGNVAIEGVKARWPIVEKAVYGPSPVIEAIPIIKAYEITQGPLLPEPVNTEAAWIDLVPTQITIISLQEDSMAKKECEVEGCTKKAWLGKRCKEHYEEKNGKWAPVKKYRKKEKISNPIEGPLQIKAKEAKRITEPIIPLFQIFLDPELLDELTKKAKAEYRNPEQQAAYYIDRALKKDSYSL